MQLLNSVLLNLTQVRIEERNHLNRDISNIIVMILDLCQDTSLLYLGIKMKNLTDVPDISDLEYQLAVLSMQLSMHYLWHHVSSQAAIKT